VAASSATQFLRNNNHVKNAVIYSSVEYTGIERYKGFMETMSDAGLSVPDKYQRAGKHCIEHGYRSMRELLSLKDRPTAVITSNYELTLGAVMAINESSLNCPEDISIIGFDNLILSHVVQPKITMVVQPMREMGEKAAKQILKRINDKEQDAPMEYILGTNLEIGNSVKKL